MNFEPKSAALGFGLVLLPFLLASIYFLMGPTLDARGRARSVQFCASLKLDAPIQQLAAQAKTDGVKLATWPATTEGVRHQVWFEGFLANGYSCEVIERNGLIGAKFTEAHRW